MTTAGVTTATPAPAREWAASLRRLLAAVGVVAVLGWIYLPFVSFSLLGTANLALQYAIVGVSLVLLTGWVGQISMAQAAFVGIGAFTTGVLSRSWAIPFPLSLPLAAGAAAAAAAGLGLVALRVRGLYLAVATLIFAWMAQSYLFNQPWFAGIGGSSTLEARPLGVEGGVPYFDFGDRRTFYFVMLAAMAVALYAAANLRDSKTGRAWFAVRGSEIAAASLGVDVTRAKLLAFAVSGFLAGAVGNVVMVHNEVVTASSFAVQVSFFYLAIAVVGGLTSLGGAVASGVLFASLEELFFRFDFLADLLDIVSAGLLAIVLLFFPAGLAGVPGAVVGALRRAWASEGVVSARRAVAGGRRREAAEADEAEAPPEETAPAVREEGEEEVEWAAPRWRIAVERVRGFAASRRQRALSSAPDVLGPARAEAEAVTDEVGGGQRTAEAVASHVELLREEVHEDPVHAPGLHWEPGTATRVSLPPRGRRAVMLAVRSMTVRFGGLTAVQDAHLEVREGEIVGLIGPNGAGKTTLFNAVSGLNEPVAGEVELFGQDVTSLAVHERARRGMGRTFQVIQLFPQLTVFDNLLVATHMRNPTGFFGHVVATAQAVEAEQEARRRVWQVVELIGLEDVADRRVAGLPFGTLRLVEISRALVTGSPFVMLDEPASGLDNTETDRFMDLLFWVRQTLGVSILVIEHDVRMVTSVSDYMYVIDRGRMIAEGTPEEVQRNPEVIAAYLGAIGTGGAEPAAPGRRARPRGTQSPRSSSERRPPVRARRS